jgi:hemerythrin-like domain-containing protein
MSTTTTPQSRAPFVGQLLLPGQAAAPEGPIDMSGMYLMHHAFRRDLRKFVVAILQTPLDDRDTWRAISRRWDRFASVLHHHHSAEDHHIWRVLEERATGADLQHLQAMEAEHARIDPQLAAVKQGIDDLSGDTLPSDAQERRAALVTHVVAARDSLGQHLAHEETEAIAILQRLFGVEEFHATDKVIMKSYRGELTFLVPWCAEELPAETFGKVLKDAGLPMRLVYWLGRRRFRALEDAAFKYAKARA